MCPSCYAFHVSSYVQSVIVAINLLTKEYCALQYSSLIYFEKKANYFDLPSVLIPGVRFQTSKVNYGTIYNIDIF